MMRRTLHYPVAARFVDFVIKHADRWEHGVRLDLPELLGITALLVNAGFAHKKIVEGKLVYHPGRSKQKVLHSNPVNQLCPFYVVRTDNKPDYFATGWLDCAFRKVLYGHRWKGEERDELVRVILSEVHRSTPFRPITLPNDGGELHEFPPTPHCVGLRYFVEHTRDRHQASGCVGIHVPCGGYIHRYAATNTQDILGCQKCSNRAYIPKTARTYGDIREAFSPTRLALTA